MVTAGKEEEANSSQDGKEKEEQEKQYKSFSQHQETNNERREDLCI